MICSSVISRLRNRRKIVSEGYLLSDLAYARIRYDLRKSDAFPGMLAVCKDMIMRDRLRPDLYILLQARSDTIDRRQQRKNLRERNVTEFFTARYYSALTEIHERLGEDRVEEVYTDSGTKLTLQTILSALKKRNVV